MENHRKSVRSRIIGTVKDQFIAGLVVVVPLAFTYVILVWLFDLVDGILRPLAYQAFGQSFPGLGIIMLVVLIYLLGVATLFLPLRKTIHGMLSLLMHMPLVKEIYGVSSQVVSTMAQTDEKTFKRVVLVEYPRAGLRSLGLVTGRVDNCNGTDWVCVFIPSTPNPTLGNMIVVPARDVVETDLTVESALKMVMSGGMIVPKMLKP